MPVTQLIAAVAGFMIVAGYAGLAWQRRRQGSSTVDDRSVLLAAPPPGMTAATAAIVDGAPTRLAFMTGLLDLASRDEIAFEQEGTTDGVANVGIAIHGGTATDPRVLLNRRQPAGEGEVWLLGQLKMAAEMAGAIGAGRGHGGQPPSAGQLQTDLAMFGALLRSSASSPADDDTEGAKEAREQGLLAGGSPDLSTISGAYEARTGRPLPPQLTQEIGAMASVLPLLSDPSAIARDPDVFAQAIERRTGHALTPEQQASLQQWAARSATPPAGSTGPEYIPASEACRLSTPFLFGTFVQTYATRHGWLGSLPFVTRLRWHLTGVAEVVAGLALVVIGSASTSDPLIGLGMGVLGGGIVTYLVAQFMVRPSLEGGQMRAQLAAYRRTLHLSFTTARSMSDAVGPSGLTWLATPDQALVWGMGLGLRGDIEALLARTADGLRAGTAAEDSYLPAWYGAHGAQGSVGPVGTAMSQAIAAGPGVGPTAHVASPATPVVITTAAAMFAGIEAIGSMGPGVRR